MTTVPVVLADIPNPIQVITNGLSSVGGWAFDKVAEGIANWVLGAVEFFVNGAIDFLRTSSTPDPNAAWFSGADSPYAAVRNLAGLLLAAFIFLGVLQGLLRGDTGGMVRRVAGGVPAAVAGIVLTTTIVGHLLALTDAMSDAVLAHTNDQALHFLSGFGASATSATGGFAAVLLGLVAAVAGLLLWVELIVRASLVYVLVAISPLAFAAIVWPATRGVLRKTVELLLAVVFSKVVICIALAIGAAALSGAGSSRTAGAGFSSNAGASAGGLLVGAVLLGLAAFSPFIVLKLVPIAESALVAQGISHAPVRGAQAGMSTVNSASNLRRLAGSSSSSSGSGATTNVASSASGAETAGASGTAGQLAGSAAGSGAAGAGAASAASGPAGVAVAAGAAAVKAGSAASKKVASTADSATDTARRHAGTDGSEDAR